MTVDEFKKVIYELSDEFFWFTIKITTVAIFIFFIKQLIEVVWFPTNTTDFDKANRSGFITRIDYGTGVVYLENKRGCLTPRLKPDGTVLVLDMEKIKKDLREGK